MIVFLAIACTLTALALFFSAVAQATGTRPLDKTPIGPWGLLVRSREPRRSLAAEERRWQTQLIKAEDDQGTWRAVLERLSELERMLGGTPPSDNSVNFDRTELHATIARLEALTEGEHRTQ